MRHTLLALIALTVLCSAAQAENEPWRPTYHFTPAKNWMNDPNGLVYHDGEWHLFYQYNPFGNNWGHMSWGHAVSRDLLQWEHLPLALPEENGVMIFSGSAVVDHKNTSGFGLAGKPPLVAIYTAHQSHNQSQAIAYSTDKGRTWTKYAGNPVLDIGEKDFRDPKVIWHEPTQRWVMAVAWCNPHKVRFYSSPDLKKWTHLSDFGPAGSTASAWECPDLFPMPFEGKTKWVLIVNVGGGAPAGGNGGQYFIGDFDGTRFTQEEPQPPAKPASDPAGKVIADFENGYAGWKVTGNCFGSEPAGGTLANQQKVSGFRGNGLVNTYLKGDGTTGTLTSPPFNVTGDWLNFLIGGGRLPGKTGVNLKVGDKVVRSSTGRDDEALDWDSWSVAEFRGKEAVVEIVDAATGGWGHINADQFMLSDSPAPMPRPTSLWLDQGPDNYASVTWSNVPASDGRRIMLGWMTNFAYAGNVPTSPWRSAMTVPRELAVKRTLEGLRLLQQPARELGRFSGQTHEFSGGSVDAANTWIAAQKISGDTLDLTLTLTPSGSGECGVDVLADDTHRTRVGYDPVRQVVFLDRTKAGRTDFNPGFAARFEASLKRVSGKPVNLRILVDAGSVEVFGGQGETVLTALVLPPPTARQVSLFGEAVAGPGSFRVLKAKP